MDVNAGSEILLSDLRQAAGVFGTESVTFWAIMPPEGPACVGGTSPEFAGALAGVLAAIGRRHTQLATAIAGHGRKLREVGKAYRVSEETVGGMVDQVMESRAVG
jgi:hypothetical protein